MKKTIVITFFALLLAGLVYADTYVNRPEPPATKGYISLGEKVITPNGKSEEVREALPNGDFRLSNGAVITPKGVIIEGEGKGGEVKLAPGQSRSDASVNLNNPITINIPGGAPAAPVVVPAPQVVPIPQALPIPQGAPVAPPIVAPQSPAAAPNWRDFPRKPSVAPDVALLPESEPLGEPEAPADEITLGALLPVTPIKPEDAVKNGEKLKIPKNSDDLDFLKGKWFCETGIYDDRTNEPLQQLVEFDANGNGRATIFTKNDKCVGKASAKFQNGTLRIRTGDQKCGRGGAYKPSTIICRAPGASAVAQCKMTNLKKNTWPITMRRVK